MAYSHAFVLATTSFFLGVLFIAFNVDYRLLYLSSTPEAAQACIQFYTTFHNAPFAVKTLLHSLVGVDILALVTKLAVWDESAMFFDGSSLIAFMAAVVLYLSVVVPGVKTIANPTQTETEAERIESLRVIGAANTMMIVCLAAVLLMQAGQEYARRYEQRELAKLQAAEAQKEASEKKEQ
ncbi:hypothetical protein FRC00_003780 [Tulasnella sp. 408]|nr:hypothetical protein FRC00_003780 [Tulasnella sp. 408]